MPRLASGVRLRVDQLSGKTLALRAEQGFELQGSAGSILRLCGSGLTVEGIVERLVEEHRDASRAQILDDVRRLLGQLVHRGIVLVDGPEQAGAKWARARSLAGSDSGEVPETRNPSRLPHEIRPYTLVAELTYRCPLRCAYCSNPVHLTAMGPELDTAIWSRVFGEAEAIGVVQVTLTGGEPLLRPDLEKLVASARRRDLYSTLITSGIPLVKERLVRLKAEGLEAVQLSIQDIEPHTARRIAGVDALLEKKRVAGWIRELGLPLTLNIVLHRENLARLPGLIALAEELGVQRLELAHVQYLGWALVNRSVLLPTAAMICEARTTIAEARDRLAGRMEIVAVLPDYFSDWPRACMDGWGRRYLIVAPDGRVLPCHAAHTLPGLAFENVATTPLAKIWAASPAFSRFRGESWMKDPCRTCDRRDVDFGGCRCQAYHLTGDVTVADPACQLSPRHDAVRDARERAEAPRNQMDNDPELVKLRLRRSPESP